MAWEKGKSGNPGGRSKGEKLWAEALRKAVLVEVKGPDGTKRKRIAMIAERVAKEAMDGDMAAAREIGDRLDGKPTQAIEGTGDAGALVVQLIRFADSEGR